MKKLTSIVIGLIMMLASVSVFAGCGQNNEPQATYYSVAVEGGTGAGKYYEGNVCEVTATVPEGKQFMKWLKNGVEVSVNETYAFEVTENSRLVAVFGDAVADADKNVYQVELTNVLGGGGYLEGSTCTVTIPTTDADLFAGWAKVTDGVVGDIVSTDKTYTFTVEEDVTLEAVYVAVRLPMPDNSENEMVDIVAGRAQNWYDRQGSSSGTVHTAFVEGVAYIKIYVYISDADDAEPIGYIKMIQNENGTAYFSNEAGSSTYNLSGTAGAYYSPDGKFQNWFKNVISTMSNGAYKTSIAYYFATQAIAVEEELNGITYCDSRISGKGSGLVNM